MNNGGPAFPGETIQHDGSLNPPYRVPHQGMSLRDWFAGQAPAMPGSFLETARPDYAAYTDKPEQFLAVCDAWEVDRRVLWANTYADAMLKARE